MRLTVKQARLISGLSQEQMAEKLGVCRHTYMQYERKPELFRIETAKQFSKIVGLSLEDIIFSI